jgi:two-component system, LytTR family, sensor kinase
VNQETKNRLLGNKRYWLCQLLFWAAIFSPDAMAAFSLRNNFQEELLLLLCAFINVLAGVFLTHFYRFTFINRKWENFPFIKYAWKFFIVIILTSCFCALPIARIYQNCQYGYESKVSDSSLIITRATFIFTWSQLAIINLLIYCCWAGIYIGAKSYIDSLKLRQNEVSLKASLKEAELAALRSHLNPHFFFNTLNTLRALVDIDKNLARDAIDCLSDLMRLALRNGSKKYVTLETEISMVRAYLSLEKIRYEERLTIIETIDKDSLKWLVPSFAIQTLVENAIKHGISTRKNGGVIILLVEILNDSTLKIEVKNPGSLEQKNMVVGTGLLNLRERLKLLFGENSHFSITDRDGEVSAILEIERLPTTKLDTENSYL